MAIARINGSSSIKREKRGEIYFAGVQCCNGSTLYHIFSVLERARARARARQ